MRRVMVLKMLERSVYSIVSSAWDKLYIHSRMVPRRELTLSALTVVEFVIVQR
jgi:hypothetical protein